MMHRRCSELHHPNYDRYGGRGICVCSRWGIFANFIADMGVPRPGMTIDRYPNKNGNYEPNNCRWATAKEQERNRNNNVMIDWNGERICLSELVERFGTASRNVVGSRLLNGWPIEKALTYPTRSKVKNGFGIRNQTKKPMPTKGGMGS
jgi:hypothetical protein